MDPEEVLDSKGGKKMGVNASRQVPIILAVGGSGEKT